MASEKFTNHLIHETSPYLLQHAHNPVDWYPWGEEALNRAREENKMIFLSIGYSSCHWCHVMAHESFENEEIASFLNEHFINIKVDREERPDLDAIYMEALQFMSGQGGWPLNVWLTPDQMPIFGGTYFPVESAYNRPGFLTVLRRLVELYEQEPDQIYERVNYLKDALQADLYDHLEASTLTDDLLKHAYNAYKENYDFKEGGFSGAPKFPASMGIEFLLRYYSVTQNTDARNMALNTLRSMVLGGIYDQVGGGIHRYSTDSQWFVPHFEKMLYDNGLLLSALCDGFQVNHESAFKNALTMTIEFLKRDMLHPDGGFYSALDADSEGEEGRYYVWTHEQIKKLLTDEEWNVISEHFQITNEPLWDGNIILHVVKSPDKSAQTLGMTIEKFEKLKQSALGKLLKERSNRIPPGKDEKIITSWNALVLKGLCKAYKCFGIEEWKQLAVNNGEFLLSKLYKDGILYRSFNRDQARHLGYLDDYALFSEALTYLFEITGSEKYLQISMKLAQDIRERFYDASKQAFDYATKDHEQLISNPRQTFDNAIPSGTSASIAAFIRVGHLSGELDYISLAQNSLERLAKTMAEHATAFGYNLQNMVQLLYPGEEIVITGSEEKRKPFEKLLEDRYAPLSFQISGKDFENSNFSPLYGKSAIDNKATVYVCKNFSCREPVTTIDAVKEQIKLTKKELSN